MREWLKSALVFLAGVAVALIIVLPVTLIDNDSSPCVPDPPGRVKKIIFTKNSLSKVWELFDPKFEENFHLLRKSSYHNFGKLFSILLPDTTDSPSSPSDQRFPDYDFISFDDMWSGNLGFNSFRLV